MLDRMCEEVILSTRKWVVWLYGCMKAPPKCVREYLEIIFILSAVVLGIVIGLILNRVQRKPYTSRQIMQILFPGELLLNMLKGTVLPLMVACLISTVGTLDLEISKRIGWQFALYVALTKIEALFLAIFIALAIRPGAGGYNPDQYKNSNFRRKATTTDRFLDLVRNMFPANIVGMTMRQYETSLVRPENGSENLYDWDVKEGGVMVYATNMLGIINYALIFGVALASLHDESRPLVDIFQSLSQLTMMFSSWIMRFSPILLMIKIVALCVEIKFKDHLLRNLGLFVLSVILSNLVQCLVVYPVIYFLLVQRNPFLLMKQFLKAIITAFATSSTIATMPVSIRCLEQEAKIDKTLVRFVIPVSHAINMDGTAMYQGVSAIFVSQLNEIPLPSGSIIEVVLLSAAASIVAAGVPHGGIVVLAMVLDNVGLPIHNVTHLLAIDWLTGGWTTVTNIFGDAIFVGILAAYTPTLPEPTESSENMENISKK